MSNEKEKRYIEKDRCAVTACSIFGTSVVSGDTECEISRDRFQIDRLSSRIDSERVCLTRLYFSLRNAAMQSLAN